MRDNFDVEFTTGLTAKKSPDFIEVIHKATAGLSEKDLIERNTIGEVKEPEDDKREESEQSEQQEESDL